MISYTISMKPILVTSYVNPDLDGVAGAIAYSEFLRTTGTDAVAGFIGELQDEAKYLLDRFHIAYPDSIQNADPFDAVVLVDSSDPNELEGKIAVEKVVEIIDHRTVTEADKFPNAKAHIELVGAAATLVAERFMQRGAGISERSATLLCGAIISNTLNFKGSVTTDRDREAFAWLNHIARLPADFWRELFLAKSDLTGKKLAQRIESDFAWFVLGGKKIGIAEIEMIGAKKLLDERGAEIVQVLERIKQDMQLDSIFQNTIELEDMKTFLVATDIETQKLLENVLQVRFPGIVAERSEAIMRKQIVPLLKEALETVI
jgi:manganese-dependent inorganic pyrophosphatase